MNKAQIYTMASCPYCQKAKRLLKTLNIDFSEIDVTNSFVEMQKTLGEKFSLKDISTVPQIILNDKYVGGYDDLEGYYKKNNLADYLQ